MTDKAPPEILITGTAPPRAELLKLALEAALMEQAPGQFRVRVLEGSLADVGPFVGP